MSFNCVDQYKNKKIKDLVFQEVCRQENGMNSVKTFARGDLICKENDKIISVFLIQSGTVSVFLPRSKKNVELYQLSSGQVIGEMVLFGINQHQASAQALSETKAIELSAEALKTQVESGPQILKLFIKSIGSKLRMSMNEMKSLKMEKDPSPCPPNYVPRVFGAIFHGTKQFGKETDGKWVVNWRILKQYSERIFMEQTKRLEQALNILVKLKLAELELGKLDEEPDTPEQLVNVHIFDLSRVEQFFDFYQYYHYKSGKGDFLKYDDLAFQITGNLLKVTEAEVPDRTGAVRVPYQSVVEKIKLESGLQINNDHWNLLEKKGLLISRLSLEAGPHISFFPKEFKNTWENWKFLREIEKWNDKGFVDPKEEDEKRPALPGEEQCPSCKAPTQPKQKFCGECGSKLSAAA